MNGACEVLQVQLKNLPPLHSLVGFCVSPRFNRYSILLLWQWWWFSLSLTFYMYKVNAKIALNTYLMCWFHFQLLQVKLTWYVFHGKKFLKTNKKNQRNILWVPGSTGHSGKIFQKEYVVIVFLWNVLLMGLVLYQHSHMHFNWQVHLWPSLRQLILRGSPSYMGFQEKKPWSIFLWTGTPVWSGFGSSSTVRYKHTYFFTQAHTLLKQMHKIQGKTYFENMRWSVNYEMMKELREVLFHLRRDEKHKGLWVQVAVPYLLLILCFSARLLWITSPRKVCADTCLCLHQSKSEMQVEFYVSDIQEVREI